MLSEIVKKLWHALLLSPCSFRRVQNPSGDRASKEGVDLSAVDSDRDGYGNVSSGNGTKKEKNLTFDMTWSCSEKSDL